MCNFCALKRLERNEEKKGNRLIIEPNKTRGGKDVYIVPAGRDLDRAEHWNIWFMNLPGVRECPKRPRHRYYAKR